MLPFKDMNPTRRTPIATYTLLLVNIAIYFWTASLGNEDLSYLFQVYSVVPANISAAPLSMETFLDIMRSMFFHGGLMHLGGNMLYLWIFGDNVEDRFGLIGYLALYFASGIAAVYAQVIVDPTSTIPMVGASGAIAGVLGSYLVLFPGVKVKGIIVLVFIPLWGNWPAWVMLLLWFAVQIFSGFSNLGVAGSGGVAFFAHIGGFAAGLTITLLFKMLYPQPPPDLRREILYRRAKEHPY